jgi:hypothetical protein
MVWSQDHSKPGRWRQLSSILLFESHELNAKTLPEEATSLADLSCGQEAWFRLKTWFMGGSSIQPRADDALAIAS